MINQEKLNNIHRLELPEVVQILDECIEALGIVDIPEAMKVLSISRPMIYQIMNGENSIKIGKHKFPAINLIT